MATMLRFRVKFVIGILVSLVFFYLAFRGADLSQTVAALKTANYWYLLPATGLLFFSHWLRALRWRYLLDPIARLGMRSLFSSLLIGYMANVLTPAHMGEFLRAYVLSRKPEVSMGSAFATIVVERIIDVFSLLGIMLLVLFIHPFPDWVINSGYIMLGLTAALFLFLVGLKKFDAKMRTLMGVILKPLPERLGARIEGFTEKFIQGIMPLRQWHDYITVSMLSVAIWVCYGVVFYICFHAFDFVATYDLVWYASLVLLAVTTISVVVPSSPGYFGAYHYLCQVSLAMFGVPAGSGLSYATVVHGINFFPVLIVGLILAGYEGVRLSAPQEQNVDSLTPRAECASRAAQ
jgi:glycosyltransferase 2 family protein